MNEKEELKYTTIEKLINNGIEPTLEEILIVQLRSIEKKEKVVLFIRIREKKIKIKNHMAL